jgi:hypothetical protein
MRSGVSKRSGKGRSGKGLRDGVISELAACFDVLPGHEEELRSAVRRFTEVVRDLDPDEGIRTGLRGTRHVIFDDGRRLLWCTTFEIDWDDFVDEAVALIGIEPFRDWIRHTRQGRSLAWGTEAWGLDGGGGGDAEVEGSMRAAARLKTVLQSVQTQAAAYFDPLGALTLPQIVEAHRLDRTLRRVLDNPAAEEVLKHPALQPLLRQAAILKFIDASVP